MPARTAGVRGVAPFAARWLSLQAQHFGDTKQTAVILDGGLNIVGESDLLKPLGTAASGVKSRRRAGNRDGFPAQF